MACEWIKWDGSGQCPVEPDVLIKLRFDGETREYAEATEPDRAGAYSSRLWKSYGGVPRIRAYCVIPA